MWSRFGDVPNYVEPFFGSGAVLFGRPTAPGVETINDKDCMVSNFWRAVQGAPDDVARWADWPVNEADLSARHLWLVSRVAEIRDRLCGSANFYDAQVAGWWVWGLCSWIGSGWCAGTGPWVADESGALVLGDGGVKRQLPHLCDAGMGINRQLPHLCDAGMGINRQLPHLGDAGMGINRQRPHLGNAQGVVRSDNLHEWFADLSARLRGVRVCCGDWARVTGDCVTTKHGITAVFLDPPYSDAAERADVYAEEDTSVAHDVRRWAIEHGDDPLLRIALCGYDGEHEIPPTWECVPWKAKGGYGSQKRDGTNDNATRERVWFSPHCLRPLAAQPDLFDR